MPDQHTLIENIRASIIGENILIDTPFGVRPLVYADYTASGRSLASIENFIQDKVLPFYANTHTETSYTGAHTTRLREEARATIASAINASDDDAIIFCGSGTTAAIDKLISLLNLRLPNDLDEKHVFTAQIPKEQTPVVFIGPYEHHSNELPWRESYADLVTIPLDDNGFLDFDKLEQALKKYQNRELKIGSFSAASNVTGLKTDVDRITRLLNQHGALSFWDYAAAAPYVGIDMQGQEPSETRKHAVFISPHKFIGGPGTPGILAVNKSLLKNRVPAVSGGGTVAYVTPESHRYIADPERREEGGTPAIVESIRAGLVFKLQQDVGTANIQELEEQLVRTALARWSAQTNLCILGNLDAPRLSIISFKITHDNKDLHYGFVVALLNDLFGIQARGGCSCAGPYAHHLLNLDMSTSNAIDKELRNGQMILRPGWVRLNFNYFISQQTFEYLVSAVELVAEHGWRLLPYYQYDTDSGTWRYQNKKMTFSGSLSSCDFAKPSESSARSAIADNELAHYLEKGKLALLENRAAATRSELTLPCQTEALRWFSLPKQTA